LDITSPNRVFTTFSEFKPDVVVHAASETNVDKCETKKEQAWKINVEGTRNIAEACQKVGAKLVYISTDYVFDGEKGLYDEEDKPNPVNYYGLTKLEGEKQVINYCENYAILRTSVLYGWHPWKQNFATWIINKLKQRQEITVVEDHYNTPTLADNLAEMALEVAEKDLRGVYHASGNERISRYEFAKQIAETFNLNSSLIKPVKMSQVAAWIAKRPRDSSLDSGKIQKKLKMKPLNITEGLNKMKEEMKT
jgi:dTDP-4-dehydrorhamnose reductase